MGFVGFLEETVVSDQAMTELPQYIQTAVGESIDGVHVTLVNNQLVVAFGEDSPTANPTVSNTTPPGPTSGASGREYYLVPLVLCSVVGGMMVM